MLLSLLFVGFMCIVVGIIWIATDMQQVQPVRHIGFQEPHRVWVGSSVSPPTSGWVVMTSAKKAIEYLENFPVSEISLDYSLGRKGAGTGQDVLRYLSDRASKGSSIPGKVLIHSKDRVGRIIMGRTLEEIGHFRPKAD